MRWTGRFFLAKQSAMRIICRNGNHSIWGNRVLWYFKNEWI